MSNLTVISADGHATPEMEDFRPYLERRHHDDFDAMLADATAKATIDFFDILDPDLARRYRETIFDSGAIEGRKDAGKRVEALAREGIVGEVLFPDGAPFGAGGLGSARTRYRADLDLAGARAYNRWILDFVGEHGDRLAPQAIASLYDIDEAIREAYWAKENGFKAIFMPGMDDERPLYWDPIYEPFWSACEEVGLPINFHGGTGLPDYGGAVVPGVPPEVRARISGFEFPYFAHRPLWFLIWSGVLERHPNLRAVFTEQHSDWVIGVLAMMDHSWHNSMMDDRLKAIVRRPPSEYFERQVWIGSSLLARGELLTRDQIGIHKMMFGADFPHPEGTFGLTREYLRATVGAMDMPESEIRAFLGGNAAEFYGFDLEALAPAVASHGLGLGEVTSPLPAEQEHILRRADALRPTTTLAPRS
jgi:predicted TIM-barrel fold metal-dependent hydrolase